MEIPKLKFWFMQSQVVVTIKFGEQKEIHKLILQEFQYGKTVKTTTNNLGYRMGKFTKVRDKGINQMQ